MNLLIDVCYNKEVAENVAQYWIKAEGDLAKLIGKIEKLSQDEITR